jgi:mRNA interferase MazF
MDRRIRRGEVWTAAGGPDYAGKPYTVVILQDDRFAATLSITVCPLTTTPTDAPLLRPAIVPSDRNGLKMPCRLMVDKIVTMPRARLGARVGRLDPQDVSALGRAVVVFLGLAG